MDHDHSTCGLDLKLRRIRAGIRQYRVAQELGIPPTTLCDWENGRRLIPARQHARILEILDRLALHQNGGDAHA